MSPQTGISKMELNGALSNPLESDKRSLVRVGEVARAIVQRGPTKHPNRRDLPRGPGEIADAVRVVVSLANEPMRMVEIHAAAEVLLGRPISRSSVKQELSTGVGRSRYARSGRGRYVFTD